MDLVEHAMKFMKRAHKDQVRKTGEPFETHPIAVAEITEELMKKCHGKIHTNPSYVNSLFIPNAKAAALLHDIIEDCPNYSAQMICDQFGNNISSIVSRLTCVKGTRYISYIKAIEASSHIEAKIIKLADVTHNLSTWPNKSGSMRDKWELTKWLLEKELRL